MAFGSSQEKEDWYPAPQAKHGAAWARMKASRVRLLKIRVKDGKCGNGPDADAERRSEGCA